MLPEYDFANMPGGVRGKYAAAYREGCNIIVLDPDVSDVFPDSDSVNQILRPKRKGRAGKSGGIISSVAAPALSAR